MYVYPFPGSNQLRCAVSELKPLLGELLFVGGATVGFYLTDEAAREPRVTRDVDTVIEAASRLDYQSFEHQLFSLGFENDISGGPICRFIKNSLILDVMPTEAGVLGFANAWHKVAMQDCDEVIVDGELIRIPTSTLFLAIKIEAFLDRGESDFVMSHDMEDLITVIDNRPTIVDEVRNSQTLAKDFVSQQFAKWLENRSFIEAIPGHLLPDPASQGRRTLVLERILSIANA